MLFRVRLVEQPPFSEVVRAFAEWRDKSRLKRRKIERIKEQHKTLSNNASQKEPSG
jgi:hypothetical protein